ncbi:uncharacterized protein LOC132042140 [Lycium ferocissimum]|uniref:uncharacterized protein LOC132042140 n=1 Tax=Lycium ferocissimum TaxID=112874 RepID=UPI002814F36A|nr:uncharacterized protein LOC132042140 [Lycium ferocissimum]
MNIGLQRGTLQQEIMVGVGSQSHNFGWTMQSCDIPGPSSAPDTSELGGGSIVRYRPTQVESFTERKAQKGRKKAIEMVFGDFETSFKTLPRYMAALKYFNPGTVVEWEHQSTTMQGEHIFKFLFWAYKPSIDGFKSCRPVISIDGTHLYGKYEMKLLIAVGIDANNNIFPLAYAIVARESFESWTWFLMLLWRHIVRERIEIGLISDRHQGILQCVQTHD